ncbi:hypothetical protein EDD85DRAFT_538570 [Armillaria nabsnona]|nr:hypothetical protein EDD85DRAFT_538570 [Armillaria nabsnona]
MIEEHKLLLVFYVTCLAWNEIRYALCGCRLPVERIRQLVHIVCNHCALTHLKTALTCIERWIQSGKGCRHRLRRTSGRSEACGKWREGVGGKLNRIRGYDSSSPCAVVLDSYSGGVWRRPAILQVKWRELDPLC